VARRMTASVDARTERIAKRFEVPMLIAASCASPNERNTGVLILALIAVATVGLSLAMGFAVGVMFAGAQKTERTPEHLRPRRPQSRYMTHR
jgi:hypothetical protein